MEDWSRAGAFLFSSSNTLLSIIKQPKGDIKHSALNTTAGATTDGGVPEAMSTLMINTVRAINTARTVSSMICNGWVEEGGREASSDEDGASDSGRECDRGGSTRAAIACTAHCKSLGGCSHTSIIRCRSG